MARRGAARQQAMPVFAPAQTIPIGNLGTVGIIKDRPGHTLPPEAFTDGNNVRFQNRNVQRILGHLQVYGTPLAAPDWVFDVPATAGLNFWLYGTKTAAYVYDNAHHTITRAAGAYATANQWDWNFGILGGVPILNNGIDIPQYWPTLASSTLLANLSNWPASTTAKVVKPFGKYLVALNIITGGVASPHMVWWSAAALPGTIPATWDPTDATHDAGQIQLTDIEGGEIQTALMLGNFLVIYKRMSTHLMSFVGGQDIMGFQMILATSGALTPRSVCAVKFGMLHFVVTQDDVITHMGYRLSAQSIVQEREKVFLFSDIDSVNYVSAFAFDNVAQREAWFCYPSNGNVLPNKVMIWNYQYNTIQFRDFNGLYADLGLVNQQTFNTWNQATFSWSSDSNPWAFPGRRGIIFSSPSASKLYLLDNTYTFDGTNPTAFVERQGLAIIGKDRQGQPIVDYNRRKLLSRIWPKVVGSSILAIKCGAQEQVGGPVVWGPTNLFNPQTQKFLDTGAAGASPPSGRLLAYNITSTDANSWELQGIDFEVSDVGHL